MTATATRTVPTSPVEPTPVVPAGGQAAPTAHEALQAHEAHERHEGHDPAAETITDCLLCREATGVWVAPRLDRPRRPLADRLDAAATAAGLVLLLVVPPLVWWAVGRWTGWGLPLHLAVTVAAGALAALGPIFLAAYLVGIRRGFRQVDAEIDERWPQYARR